MIGQGQWRRYCERAGEKEAKNKRSGTGKTPLKPPKSFKNMTLAEVKEWNEMARVGKMGR